MTPLEMYAVGDRTEKLYQPEMKKLQEAGQERGRASRHGKVVSPKLGETRDDKPKKSEKIAAAAAGTSTGSYAKIRTVAEARLSNCRRLPQVAAF